jgi:hypothetical protein
MSSARIVPDLDLNPDQQKLDLAADIGHENLPPPERSPSPMDFIGRNSG